MNMNMNMKFDKEEVRKEIVAFEDSFRSVILGTISKDGKVDVTYAPYVKHDGEFYIFISEIADHYNNLAENKQTFEIMFLQDETAAVSPLVRQRLRYNVTAEFQARDEKFEAVLDTFENTVGEAMKFVRKMQDFHLVKLNVLDGRFVKGFGQAYNLIDGDIIPMTGDKNGKGHR